MVAKRRPGHGQRRKRQEEGFLKRLSNNIIWIIFLVIALYIFLSGFLEALFLALLYRLPIESPALRFINDNYTFTIIAILVLVDAALGIGVILLAKKSGRLGELLLSYEKKAELAERERQHEESID